MENSILFDSLCRYIGQTVTIFTTSGGLSGNGFTGVLIAVNENSIKLISQIGAAPSCPIGSNCGWGMNCGCNNWRRCGCGSNYYGENWLGSVTEIPICRIASFVHNAI